MVNPDDAGSIQWWFQLRLSLSNGESSWHWTDPVYPGSVLMRNVWGIQMPQDLQCIQSLLMVMLASPIHTWICPVYPGPESNVSIQLTLDRSSLSEQTCCLQQSRWEINPALTWHRPNLPRICVSLASVSSRGLCPFWCSCWWSRPAACWQRWPLPGCCSAPAAGIARPPAPWSPHCQTRWGKSSSSPTPAAPHMMIRVIHVMTFAAREVIPLNKQHHHEEFKSMISVQKHMICSHDMTLWGHSHQHSTRILCSHLAL